MRNIYIINATQVVVSGSPLEGVYSPLPDYPKQLDFRNYNITKADLNSNEAYALGVAQAEFYNRVSTFLTANSTTHAMQTV